LCGVLDAAGSLLASLVACFTAPLRALRCAVHPILPTRVYDHAHCFFDGLDEMFLGACFGCWPTGVAGHHQQG